MSDIVVSHKKFATIASLATFANGLSSAEQEIYNASIVLLAESIGNQLASVRELATKLKHAVEKHERPADLARRMRKKAPARSRRRVIRKAKRR